MGEVPLIWDLGGVKYSIETSPVKRHVSWLFATAAWLSLAIPEAIQTRLDKALSHARIGGW